MQGPSAQARTRVSRPRTTWPRAPAGRVLPGLRDDRRPRVTHGRDGSLSIRIPFDHDVTLTYMGARPDGTKPPAGKQLARAVHGLETR
jgi:hypothetical protein